jgi:hypothetical protein
MTDWIFSLKNRLLREMVIKCLEKLEPEKKNFIVWIHSSIIFLSRAIGYLISVVIKAYTYLLLVSPRFGADTPDATQQTQYCVVSGVVRLFVATLAIFQLFAPPLESLRHAGTRVRDLMICITDWPTEDTSLFCS